MDDTYYWTIEDSAKWASTWDDVVGDVHRIVDYVNAHPESMTFTKKRTGPCRRPLQRGICHDQRRC
ncbi:uncharacterized protein SCHCODRAFT_02618924 [Schizophyllum commune H4-8]|uniref:uncharacterized protein n=1 Tax=Schizophyllum commune (strain H4-8 / FGSC 9210) TaxID=578458 RepID=UPI00215DEFF6|nr:uncharacterized protein SCHCODRAFT_02618924 [Schizophyllum commune H4-8]KAI5895258.1 hypothetical protein SCHCODRAFT_02618924 [Schizophyllum commune H4-8]